MVIRCGSFQFLRIVSKSPETFFFATRGAGQGYVRGSSRNSIKPSNLEKLDQSLRVFLAETVVLGIAFALDIPLNESFVELEKPNQYL